MRLARVHRQSLKWLIITLGVVVFLFLAIGVPAEQWQQWIKAAISSSGSYGEINLVLLYSVAVICLAPLSPFAIMAGVFFGFWKGALLALLGLNLGALAAFAISRTCQAWRNHSTPSNNQKHTDARHGFLHQISENRVSSIALLRLNPLVPFNLHNYVYGCARHHISYWRYVLGTLIGSAPMTLLLVYLGFAGRFLIASGEKSTPFTALIAVTAIASLLPFWWMRQRRKKALAVAPNHYPTTNGNPR